MADVGGLRKVGRDGLIAEEVSAPFVGQSLAFERQWTSEARGGVLDPLGRPFYDVEGGHDRVSMGPEVRILPKPVPSRPDSRWGRVHHHHLVLRRGCTSSGTTWQLAKIMVGSVNEPLMCARWGVDRFFGAGSALRTATTSRIIIRTFKNNTGAASMCQGGIKD